KLITEYFDDVPYTLSSQELIDLGYCVPPELKILDVNPLDKEDLYASILASYNQNHKGQKAIIFLKTIEECKDVAQLFDMSGINSIAITSEYTGKSRDKTLNEFRSNKKGSPMVLTTVNVLTAGFDSPNVEVIYMPYPIDSVVSYVQRVGRGLRICPEINKTKCIVYAASKTPKLEEGKWIKMNNTLLGANRKKSNDDYMSDLDYSLLTEVKRRWTLDVVNMAKEIERKGLTNLSSMVINKQFPEDLLDVMKDMPICKPYKYSKAKATPAQIKVLKRYEINSNVTKQEASILIDGIAKKERWKIPEWKVVQTGTHKGKLWKNISYMYIKALPWGNETKREWNLYRAKLKEVSGK
ncbi:MAG: helicase-related protein, partial [Nanoarchaeota archaeon]|nr:helicase-related protein [Nanoarchaeota archaeon]